MDEYFELGYVKKTSGLKGMLLVQPDTDRAAHYLGTDAFFLEESGQAVPYFIEECSLDSKGLMRVRFEEIEDADAARRLVGKKVFLPLHQLPALEGKQFYFHEVIGWKAIDENDRTIGSILDVLDRGPQELLLVKSAEEKEIYLPLADDFILDVDRAKRELKLVVPEGLLDL
jgi:16S rRNA processing protein RimM